MIQGRGHWRLTALAAVALVMLAVPAVGAANGDDGPSVVVADGVTQPAFGYTDAIRESVWVQAPFDSDHDGQPDRIAVDLVRPREAAAAHVKVPVIMDASPYYTCCGRGNENEVKTYDANGTITKEPLFYDNYFVPRGYAFVAVDLAGTNRSTGCGDVGGNAEVLGAKAAVDWLNGRATATYADGTPAVATAWTNGKVGMIGKSWDGTIANGVAATGVAGLKTIVPISAISSWYDYTRFGGVLRSPGYVDFLATFVGGRPAGTCDDEYAADQAASDDATGNFNQFWAERDYRFDAGHVHASVFVVHGINDQNVTTNQFGTWWNELAARGVPRKIWLHQGSHVDPFDMRRADWVDELHKWFDFWLQGVQTNILRDPAVDYERSAETWEVSKQWPAQNSSDTNLWLQPSETPGTFGTLTKQRPSRKQTPVTFLDNPTQSQNAMISITAAQGLNRLVFLSPALLTDLRFSGTPRAELVASADQTDTNLGVLVVDYGTEEQVRHHERRRHPHVAAHRGAGDLLGRGEPRLGRGRVLPADGRAACHRVAGARHEGRVDALNRNSYSTAEPLVVGQSYGFNFPLLPEDYVFKAGHRIGIVVVGSYSQYSTIADQTRANITLNVHESSIVLPIQGGSRAAIEAGL